MRLFSFMAACACLANCAWGLTPEQVERYHRDGYLVIENFVSAEQCDMLKQRAIEMVEDRGAEAAKEIFSCTKRPSDKFFLDSAVATTLFFEPKALDDSGALTVELDRAVNKIGHGMHDTDPVFSKFVRQPQIQELVADLGIKEPLLLQSMYIFKQPKIGGEVNCHQDGTFLYTEPENMIGLWFAIEDATLENGCLWAIPGGHVNPLKSRFKRSPEGKTYFEVYDSTPWNLDGRVPLEVKKGGLVVLHGRVPHMSEANLSDKSRHAYTLHVIDGTSDYPEDNWLQRPVDIPAKGF
jgi:phytanoyl-CoA hydroxylase